MNARVSGQCSHAIPSSHTGVLLGITLLNKSPKRRAEKTNNRKTQNAFLIHYLSYKAISKIRQNNVECARTVMIS